MSTRDWIEVILAVVLVLNLVVLSSAVIAAVRHLRELSLRIHQTLDRIERDTTAALEQSRESLQRVSQLSEALTSLVRSDLTPTAQVARAALQHVEQTLKGVADATTTVRRLAAGAEALTAPSAMSAAVERVAASNVGRVALLLAGLLTLSRGLLRRPRNTRTRTKEEENDGPTGQ